MRVDVDDGAGATQGLRRQTLTAVASAHVRKDLRRNKRVSFGGYSDTRLDRMVPRAAAL